MMLLLSWTVRKDRTLLGKRSSPKKLVFARIFQKDFTVHDLYYPT